jgi:hypothetical protein
MDGIRVNQPDLTELRLDSKPWQLNDTHGGKMETPFQGWNCWTTGGGLIAGSGQNRYEDLSRSEGTSLRT